MAMIPASSGLSRQFWTAGDYYLESASTITTQSGTDRFRVHPKFLHSNATSHKWALGAIAELLDNAVDEIQNGATFVIVDKVTSLRDNSPALLIQDDGGGMDPECLRQCMSWGYSQKNPMSTIGQYGNGFKTSTMRLGADVIVFSSCNHNSISTQSIGLLSYTFLTATGHEDIVIPMVDYELNDSSMQPKRMIRSTEEDWSLNMSTLLQWSPYSTEEDMLKQFDDIGPHGTKIIIYNLWLNVDNEMELDFESDKEDIRLRREVKDGNKPSPLEEHISSRLRFSLRAYSSVLYLRRLNHFKIILRGVVVEQVRIAEDLKHKDYYEYKPQDVEIEEDSVITTMGFAKEAPHINLNGFNVYHKNRLILPFWKVFHENSSRGRGVVGVLEANFIQPAHDKQDFERSPVFHKLENRLKQLTLEYWNKHCEYIGYDKPSKPKNVPKKRPRSPSSAHQGNKPNPNPIADIRPVISNFTMENRPQLSPQFSNSTNAPDLADDVKPDLSRISWSRNPTDSNQFSGAASHEPESSRRQPPHGKDASANVETSSHDSVGGTVTANSHVIEELLEEKRRLDAQILEYETRDKQIQGEIREAEGDLKMVKEEYTKLLVEAQSLI